MNDLSFFYRSLSDLSLKETLETVCADFHQKLRLAGSLDLLEPLLTPAVLCFCVLIREIYDSTSLTSKIRDFLEFVLGTQILDSSSHLIMEKFIQRNSSSIVPDLLLKRNQDEKKAETNFENLKSVFSCSKLLSKAILDLNGNFLWADAKARKMFELSNRSSGIPNLFIDIIIPMSRHYFEQRFKNFEIFDEKSQLGSSVKFSFVIYSKSSFIKHAKASKKKGRTNQKGFPLDEDSDNLSFYFKYLRALSSEASLEALQFKRGELERLEKSGELNKTLIEQIKTAFKKMRSNPSDTLEESKKNVKKKSSKGDIAQDFSIKCVLGSTSDEDVVYKLVVLLLARPSKNIPKFPFAQMADDPRIKEMNEGVRKKSKRIRISRVSS